MAIDHVLWMEDFGIRAGRQLCCDSENLYVYLFTVGDEIRAAYRVPLFPVCQDSCPEFFFTRADYESYSKRQIYLPFTIAASGGCERARKEISRFAARARRGVNVQNEIRFDVYDRKSRAPT